jgi:hypothetical protein
MPIISCFNIVSVRPITLLSFPINFLLVAVVVVLGMRKGRGGIEILPIPFSSLLSKPQQHGIDKYPLASSESLRRAPKASVLV